MILSVVTVLRFHAQFLLLVLNNRSRIHIFSENVSIYKISFFFFSSINKEDDVNSSEGIPDFPDN